MSGVAAWLSRYDTLATTHDTRQLEIFVRNGLPQEVATALRQGRPRRATLDRPGQGRDGHRRRVGARRRAQPLDGCTTAPGTRISTSSCTRMAAPGRLIGGDHLLPHAPPVAIMAPRVRRSTAGATAPDARYLTSLRATPRDGGHHGPARSRCAVRGRARAHRPATSSARSGGRRRPSTSWPTVPGRRSSSPGPSGAGTR